MYSFPKHHLTAIGQVFTCHNIQKSCLSSAIFSNKGNLLVFIDADTQLLPDDLTLPLVWLGLLFNWQTGFVSLEVSPELAKDAQGTGDEARRVELLLIDAD